MLCLMALQFKDHLKKNEAISEFAKNKTIAEQRRFLPVYGVREEMLQVGTPAVPGSGCRRRCCCFAGRGGAL